MVATVSEIRIDELARRSGLTVDTIRFYQREGLLPPAARAGRAKVYGQDHLDRLAGCDARFDILHFEEVSEEGEEETFDPSALLMVIEALAKLTDGVAVDPQSGTIM